ncbi:MAG: hypothetical protein LRY41_02380 [Candidatus Pacebacteria bacterium]|nr:hypothetical protein [Candidatus Paceibacterota bacterium]MCD8507941.1 hypothetical protein [Candidatus Paceibacterota bacterium]MCD8528152.1 hypothetical protein [Candidatus Paceibacterota bacterium]MCD8563652.1 hypothetical protein [Candidatus Paceibacterota bacterium]
MSIAIFKVVAPLIVTFLVGIGITPLLSHIMYTYRLWKRSDRGNHKENPGISAEFSKIHNGAEELSTPRVGGVVIWISVLISVAIFVLAQYIFEGELFDRLVFVSRNQTWIPLAGLVIASLVGLVDDLLQVYGSRSAIIDGLSRPQRIAIIALLGFLAGWWFFVQLGMSSVFIPFLGNVFIGWLIIPFFMVVMLATFSGGVIDGVDGLSGGVLATIFASYAFIAFIQNQIDLAAFSAAITGGILAFLWFNIPPARFYMGETGMMGLTVALTLIAFLTNQVFVLPIIAFPLVITSASVIIQKTSRALRGGKKVFLIAPLHHHFQALGWSSEKVTMRYWIISLMCAFAGIVIVLIG